MPILRHPAHHERDHVPATSVAFVVPDQTMPSPDTSVDVLRIVDSRGAADFATFAELVPGPAVVCVDEVAELFGQIETRRALALAQRTEIHVGLEDEWLGDLAARAVYPRRPWWRRILTAAAAIVGTAVRP
jgi:hypothetical protein